MTTFFVILQSENGALALPDEHITRLNADVAATDALKSGVQVYTKGGLMQPPQRALICQVVAHAEASVTLTERK